MLQIQSNKTFDRNDASGSRQKMIRSIVLGQWSSPLEMKTHTVI